MSKRRIISAKEQYELLHPWRIAAPVMAPDVDDDVYVADGYNKPQKLPKPTPAPPSPKMPPDQSVFPIDKNIGSPTDILSEWSEKRSDPQAPPGPREPIAPWANKLEQSLYKEFMEDWWPNSTASKERNPDNEYTGWKTMPHEPITHWLNVEDFLNERYPEAATGSLYGLEDVDRILDIGQARGWDVPQDILDKNGYTGSGNVITQAMLNLHNKLQGRTWATDSDKYRYYELMLKHIGPGARRLSMLLRTAYRTSAFLDDDDDDDWDFGVDYDDTPYWAMAWDGWEDDDDDDEKVPPKRKHAASQGSLIEFFQWCTDKQLRPNRAALEAYSQQSDVSMEDFLNISSMLTDMGLDGYYLELLRHAAAMGDCYEAAGRHLLDSGAFNDPESPLRLVHGEVAGQGPLQGTTFGHAWVEDGDTVIDKSNGRHVQMPKSIYYALGKINELNNYHSYTPEQARNHMLNLQHFGPWELTVNGEAPPGRVELDDEEDEYEDDDYEYPDNSEGLNPNSGGWKEAQRFWSSREKPRIGININDSHQDYTGQILRGEKTIETRDTHSLKPYVGQRVGLVRTGLGPATLVGYANVGEPVFYETPEQFDADYQHHRVAPDSPHYIRPGGKYGYPISEVEPTEPRMLKSRGIKSRSLEAQRFWAMASPQDAYDQNPNEDQRAQAEMPLRENTSGKWYHVSPHKMDPDTILSPGGGTSPYNYNNADMPTQRQKDWVWMDGPDAVRQWYYGTLMGQIQQGNENPWAHIYEVEPSEGPHPWNGSGHDGHVAPSARIVREIATDKYNRLPDHLGATEAPKTAPLRFWAAYPRDDKKIVWSPEENGLIQELAERMRFKYPDLDASSAQDTSKALQEYIQWDKEREIGEAQRPDDYDKAYNDWENEAETRTAQRFWAMADTTKWHPMIKYEESWRDGGKYHITMPSKVRSTGDRIAELDYSIIPAGRKKWDEKTKNYVPREHPEVYVNSLIVHPDHQGKGVAQALVERLAKDFPDHRVNPGATTPQGNGLVERLRTTVPDADQRIVTNYEPYLLDQEDVDHYNKEQLDRLVSAKLQKTAIELTDEEAKAFMDYVKTEAFQKLFSPIQSSGKWYHVSPHEIEPGARLIAGGPEGKATSQDFYDMGFGDDTGTLQDMGGGRTKHVWVTPDLEDAHFWSAALNAPHIYEVDPDDDPQPWNGTGADGWVSSGARIRNRIDNQQDSGLVEKS